MLTELSVPVPDSFQWSEIALKDTSVFYWLFFVLLSPLDYLDFWSKDLLLQFSPFLWGEATLSILPYPQLIVLRKHTFFLVLLRFLVFWLLLLSCLPTAGLQERLTPTLYLFSLSRIFWLCGQILKRICVMSLQTQLDNAFLPPGWIWLKEVSYKTFYSQKQSQSLRCFPQLSHSSIVFFIQSKNLYIIQMEIAKLISRAILGQFMAVRGAHPPTFLYLIDSLIDSGGKCYAA